jgi:hypothetical protein
MGRYDRQASREVPCRQPGPGTFVFRAFPVMLWCALMGYLPAAALAQGPSVSQFISTTNRIVDEWGRPLNGTDPASDRFGIAAVEGDIVQILHATDNTIYPPDLEGNPDPRNVVLMTTRIGIGVEPTDPTPARFSAALTPRPGGNSRIFVRVFNAGHLPDASFYGDSQLYKVISFDSDVFIADISSTSIPLDPEDSDGDGLHNSWEKSFGSRPHVVDSDEDGFTDLEEFLTGTLAREPFSYLAVESLAPAGHDILLRWKSVPGLLYQVQFADGLEAGTGAFVPVGNVVATGEETESVVPASLANPRRSYRVVVHPAGRP